MEVNEGLLAFGAEEEGASVSFVANATVKSAHLARFSVVA